MPQVWRGNLPREVIGPKSTEKILLCGWRRDMEDMIMVMLQESLLDASRTYDYRGFVY